MSSSSLRFVAFAGAKAVLGNLSLRNADRRIVVVEVRIEKAGILLNELVIGLLSAIFAGPVVLKLLPYLLMQIL